MSREQHQFYDALYGLDVDGRYERAWEASGILLSAFKTAVEKSGARFMLVYVPAIVQVEAEEWAPKLRDLVGRYDLLKPNKRLGAIAGRYGIDFLDLYPAFEEEARRQPLYYRDSHWNPAGHALAARQIAAAWAQASRRRGMEARTRLTVLLCSVVVLAAGLYGGAWVLPSPAPTTRRSSKTRGPGSRTSVTSPPPSANRWSATPSTTARW